MVTRYADAMRSMRGIWVGSGAADEHYLDLGAHAFHRALGEASVPAETVHFELFPGGHGDIDHSYPLSLAWLARRLAPGD
jgi:hypothetical protein